MPRGKSSKKLPEQKAPKPAYVMPAPNSDIEAYGWDMSKIRHPDPNSEDKRDPDPGVPVFTAPEATWENRQRYGHDIHFLCPQYVQLMLDRSEAVRNAALAAHEARYTAASLEKIEEAIRIECAKTIFPQIDKCLAEILPMLARFYAARIAHIKKFGHD